MKTQRVVNRCLLGLVIGLAWAMAPMSIGRADEVVYNPFMGQTKTPGESYSGDILKGPEKDAFLKAHNDARKAVGLEPLAWSDDIANYSLQWLGENKNNYLDAVVAGKPPPITHRPNDGEFKRIYGENLAAWWGDRNSTETNASNAVAQWLAEKAAFDKLNEQKPYVVGDEAEKMDDNGKAIVVGHYTQIVWKDTKKVGAAKWTFQSKDRTVVVIVGNYDPTGNFTGKKPY